MIAARVLDVILVLLLIAYLAVGFRTGFSRMLGSIIGIAVGAVLAFLAVPVVAALVPAAEWRSVAALAAGIGLLIAGASAGTAIGNALRPPDRVRPLAGLDRLLGSALGVTAAALVSSLVLGSVGALGAPVLSQAVAGSGVLRAIQSITPEPVESGISRVRSAILQEGLPSIAEALGGITSSPGAPQASRGEALDAAAGSVVRIGGTAYACGQNQSGSGFVVADDRVVTNAHVVAGVGQPIVEAAGGRAVEGRVVYFDPVDDLAVIATDGLDVPALPLSAGLSVGEEAVVDGYPYGGPFTSGGAQVLAVSTESVPDIYGRSSAPREVYTLAAVIEPGNSGGPLLALDGSVAGVVFAESSVDPELGYAMTGAELTPVAEAAPTLSAPVDPGACTRS